MNALSRIDMYFDYCGATDTEFFPNSGRIPHEFCQNSGFSGKILCQNSGGILAEFRKKIRISGGIPAER